VPDVDDNVPAVWSMLSEPRMTPYLRIARDSQRDALTLYEWSARTSAAAFEVVGHLEVLLRNALDRQLRDHFREDKCGIPWFLLPTPGGEHVSDAVAAVRERLRPLGKESRHQIVAGLTFGFCPDCSDPSTKPCGARACDTPSRTLPDAASRSRPPWRESASSGIGSPITTR